MNHATEGKDFVKYLRAPDFFVFPTVFSDRLVLKRRNSNNVCINNKHAATVVVRHSLSSQHELDSSFKHNYGPGMKEMQVKLFGPGTGRKILSGAKLVLLQS